MTGFQSKRLLTQRHPDPYLIPLDRYLAEAEKAMDEALWDEDDPDRIRQLQDRIDYARGLIDDGTLFVPTF